MRTITEAKHAIYDLYVSDVTNTTSKVIYDSIVSLVRSFYSTGKRKDCDDVNWWEKSGFDNGEHGRQIIRKLITTDLTACHLWKAGMKARVLWRKIKVTRWRRAWDVAVRAEINQCRPKVQINTVISTISNIKSNVDDKYTSTTNELLDLNHRLRILIDINWKSCRWFIMED